MADQHASQEACFPGIPAELRLNIYTHYFATFTLDTSPARLNQDDLQASLLNTCRLMLHEALPLYKARIEHTRDEAGRESEERMAKYREGTIWKDNIFEAGLMVHTCMGLVVKEQQEWARVSEVYALELRKIEEMLRKLAQ